MNTFRKTALTAAVFAASIAGGAIGATFLGTAGAQTSPTTAASSAPSTPSSAPSTDPSGRPAGQPPAQHDPSKGGHQANGITEELLTGDTAAQVTAAAQAAVPGATIERVETDAEGAAYEAHIVKADGTHAIVTFNADYSVASLDAGH